MTPYEAGALAALKLAGISKQIPTETPYGYWRSQAHQKGQEYAKTLGSIDPRGGSRVDPYKLQKTLEHGQDARGYARGHLERRLAGVGD